jgi:hypothetical protein
MKQYSVKVTDNGTLYRGVFEAESPEHLVELVRKTEPVSNCPEFWVTPIVKFEREYVCGLLDPCYVDEATTLREWSFAAVASYGEDCGLKILFKEKKKEPKLNTLFKVEWNL